MLRGTFLGLLLLFASAGRLTADDMPRRCLVTAMVLAIGEGDQVRFRVDAVAPCTPACDDAAPRETVRFDPPVSGVDIPVGGGDRMTIPLLDRRKVTRRDRFLDAETCGWECVGEACRANWREAVVAPLPAARFLRPGERVTLRYGTRGGQPGHWALMP